jgi:TAP-like protein
VLGVGVSGGDAKVTQPVSSNIPTLIFLGRFDPVAPLALVRGAMGRLSRSWVVVDPTAGHNALGSSDCLRTIRASWVDDPTSAPAATSCLDQLKLTFDVPSA